MYKKRETEKTEKAFYSPSLFLVNNVLWYLRRLQRSCCSAADLLLILSLSCGFAHGDPKTTPLPTQISSPTHYELPKLNRDANLSFVCTTEFFLSSQWAFGFPRLFVWDPVFSQGNTQPSSTLSHRRPMYDIFSVPFGVCCFLEPNRGDFVLTCTPKGEKQTPIWTPGVCPLSSPWTFLIVVYISIR